MMHNDLFSTPDKTAGLTFALAKSGVGLWHHDLRSGVVTFSEEWAQMLGLRTADLDPDISAWFSRIHRSDKARLEKAVREIRSGSRQSYSEEHRLRHTNGDWIWVMTCGFAWRLNAEGKPDILVGTHIDISGRRKTEDALRASEADLRASEAKLRALMEAAPVGISFSSDTTCRTITGNTTVLTQFDADRSDNLSASAPTEADIGRNVEFYHQGRRIKDSELPLQRAIAEGREIGAMDLDVRLPSGRRWFCEAYGAPIRNERGEIVAGVAVTVDVSARKAAEARARLLMEEFSHREKNVLAKVQAIARQIRQTKADKPVIDRLSSRIEALARSQALLIEHQCDGVDLRALLLGQLEFLGETALERIGISGETVKLTMIAAQTLGMCFHELATNASKHGALQSKGRISVSWRMTDQSEFEIRWDEVGLSTPARNGKSGFGTKLLTKMAAYELLGRANLVIAGSTLRWRCEIPLTNLAGSAPHPF